MWTWWQWFDFYDCDSAADSVTSTYCAVFAWRRTILVIMPGLGQNSAIAAYQEQANSMRRSNDENGLIQMNMYSLGVMDLDLSISPDVFGLRAFDAEKPVTRMLPGSSPCELRLMLPDDKLGADGFHDVIIENFSATPTWQSSHVPPADMTSLRRRWPKAVFSTLRRRASDIERLRRDAPKRTDKAFRYSGPGFCGVCDTRIYSALDAHMMAHHLELGQLWRCPVTWCAVWKGSGRACLEHMAEKHGGSTLEITTNVAKFFPPWTVTQDVWLAALRPDVSGVAVDALLFHEAGRRLVHRYRVYKDPFPHPALHDGVIPRLLSCVVRAMAITRLTHLRISISSSGAPPGQVPPECFPGKTAPVQQCRRRVSFADEIIILDAEDTPEDPQLVPPLILPVIVKEMEVLISETGVPPLTLPVVEDISYDTPASEMVPMTTTPPESSLPPPPGFAPFVFPENDGGMDFEDMCTLFSGDSSLTLSPISRGSSDISNTPDVPEVGAWCPLLKDRSSVELPAVGYARLPLPSVDNSLMPELVWVPALPQPTGRIVEGEVSVAVGPGGPVPCGEVAGVYPFIGSGLRLQEHYLPCVRLCRTGGGLRPSPEPPAIR